jgi:hypothetical protein
MDEQDLDGRFANAVEQQSGAAFAHHLIRLAVVVSRMETGRHEPPIWPIPAILGFLGYTCSENRRLWDEWGTPSTPSEIDCIVFPIMEHSTVTHSGTAFPTIPVNRSNEIDRIGRATRFLCGSCGLSDMDRKLDQRCESQHLAHHARREGAVSDRELLGPTNRHIQRPWQPVSP